MAVTLTVRDETMTGAVVHERPLEFPAERITVRDLIRERVYQEVQDFNRQPGAEACRGLVRPADPARRAIDWRPQFDRAIEAFDQGGYFILVDDRQAESLDQELTIGRDTAVSFVRLTMLVGG